MPRKPRSKIGQENLLIDLAINLEEERLRSGKATSAEIVHFLKLGTERERLEREKLESENKLLKAKTEAIENTEELKTLYINAIKAIGTYTGDDGG